VRLVWPAGTTALALNLPSLKPIENSTVTVSAGTEVCSPIDQHCSETRCGWVV